MQKSNGLNYGQSSTKHARRNTQLNEWLSDSSRVHQIRFRPELLPWPSWGAYDVPPDPLGCPIPTPSMPSASRIRRLRRRLCPPTFKCLATPLDPPLLFFSAHAPVSSFCGKTQVAAEQKDDGDKFTDWTFFQSFWRTLYAILPIFSRMRILAIAVNTCSRNLTLIEVETETGIFRFHCVTLKTLLIPIY